MNVQLRRNGGGAREAPRGGGFTTVMLAEKTE
jgi:hypothetical protein